MKSAAILLFAVSSQAVRFSSSSADGPGDVVFSKLPVNPSDKVPKDHPSLVSDPSIGLIDPK